MSVSLRVRMFVYVVRVATCVSLHTACVSVCMSVSLSTTILLSPILFPLIISAEGQGSPQGLISMENTFRHAE